MDRLSEIRARCDAATPGPWGKIGTAILSLLENPYNITFIAHSREDIPYLLSEIERIKTQCDINATSFFDMRDQLKKAAAERDTYKAALQNWHEQEGAEL